MIKNGKEKRTWGKKEHWNNKRKKEGSSKKRKSRKKTGQIVQKWNKMKSELNLNYGWFNSEFSCIYMRLYGLGYLVLLFWDLGKKANWLQTATVQHDVAIARQTDTAGWFLIHQFRALRSGTQQYLRGLHPYSWNRGTPKMDGVYKEKSYENGWFRPIYGNPHVDWSSLVLRWYLLTKSYLQSASTTSNISWTKSHGPSLALRSNLQSQSSRPAWRQWTAAKEPQPRWGVGAFFGLTTGQLYYALTPKTMHRWEKLFITFQLEFTFWSFRALLHTTSYWGHKFQLKG